MGPLGIYITMMLVVLLFAIAIRFVVKVVTRRCHQCGEHVTLGRQRCQACGYRFDQSRW
jgi:hypothetical protein